MFIEEKANEEQTPTTVLVADDDPITRGLLKRFLEDRGHQVLVAVDGEQAWSLYQAHRPRLVVSDWRMPKLDGPSLCARIRGCESSDYTFFLLLTSLAEREAMVQGFASGADDFMTKPFDRAELVWRIYSGMRVIGLHSTLETRIRQLDEARSRLEQANEQMRTGLNAAAKTQRALLPKSAPDVKGIHCAWSYEPSDHLGGDSLNLFKLDEHKVGFFVADVCGHGLPSALLSVTLHRVLTPVLNQAGLLSGDGEADPIELFSDPGQVLTAVNQRFPMRIEEGEYFTAAYGVIDSEAGMLHFAGAGHPNPLLISQDGTTAKLATEGFPVGFDDATIYETQSVKMRPGDRVYLYSDGIIECKNPAGEMFGMDRLADRLQSNINASVDEAVKEIVQTRAAWEQAQEDDISMLLIEFTGKTISTDNEPVKREDSAQQEKLVDHSTV